MSQAETLSFATETRQLLKLMIHSLYSNREIFLRELVSNASDALDKLRFEGYSDAALMDGGGELGIEIECDPEAHTVTVRDNGIGMSREEVIANIGTIAHSGTAEFLQDAAGRPDAGRAPDRPVRRRFLLGLHRRRPRHADHPPRRPAGRGGRALAVGRRGRVQHRDRQRAARDANRAAPARRRARVRRRLAPQIHHPHLLRPHHLPGAHAGRQTRRRRGRTRG